MVLKNLEKEKDDLDFRIIQLARQRKNYAANTVAIAADLLAIDTEISTLTNLVAAFAEGERKEDTITDLDRAKVQRRVLVSRQKDYGAVALIERELELAMANSQLVDVNTATTEVTERRGKL